MRISGFDHLQIAIPPGGEDSARQFYGDLLGLVEFPKPQPLTARGGCWFQGSGIQIHLGVQRDFTPASKAHPAFLVTDLEQARHTLAAAGIPIVPDDSVPVVRRFYAADPFGNRLEFIQDGNGFSQ